MTFPALHSAHSVSELSQLHLSCFLSRFPGVSISPTASAGISALAVGNPPRILILDVMDGVIDNIDAYNARIRAVLEFLVAF